MAAAPYGAIWRLLRRNLASDILHPSQIKSFDDGRKWVLEKLTNKLRQQARSGEPVHVTDEFRHALFSLKTIFRKQWDEVRKIRREQDNILLPLIRARQEQKKNNRSCDKEEDKMFISYVDTLLDLQLPGPADKGIRKLREENMLGLCSEFLNAVTDTTASAFQWIMASLVKHQNVQEKLFSEIKEVTRPGEDIKEDDLQRMPYLKAVVLEGLRRHPPVHLLFPHAVTEDISIDGYVIPKNAMVRFMVADMSWDPKVRKDPMDFNPERFMTSCDGEQKGGEVAVPLSLTYGLSLIIISLLK
uniref:Cytochrome P450 89A2-like n=1 Tax=Nelumbo nucifera TaxID=4432 RepID=A0A822XGL2_NELNU|nr:TPA_asm: hypothetical protein HUJ06_020830 [Nelumbo nucifera]